MPLDPKREQAIRAEAKRRGVDPDEAVRRADGVQAGPAKDGATGKPVAERLLVGFLPFIKVRELRTEWLGLTERIPDDEMTCGDYALKHGGGAAPAPAAPEVE